MHEYNPTGTLAGDSNSGAKAHDVVDRAKLLLAGVIARTDLDLHAAALLQLAAADLSDTRHPPSPTLTRALIMAAPTTDPTKDLSQVVDLLTAAGQQAPDAVQDVALAAIAAQVQDSLERLRASTTGSPMTPVHLSHHGDQVEPDE